MTKPFQTNNKWWQGDRKTNEVYFTYPCTKTDILGHFEN